MFRYLLLGLLRDGEPRHGYALMKSCKARSGLQASSGNIYRELQRLVSEGLVRISENPPEADARRTPYQINEAGKIAFDSWLEERPRAESVNDCCADELSTRAMFLGGVEVAVGLSVLEGWKDALWVCCREVEHRRRLALREGSDDCGVLPILLGRRLKHLAADVEVVEELRVAYLAHHAAKAERQASAAQPPPQPSEARTRRTRSVQAPAAGASLKVSTAAERGAKPDEKWSRDRCG